MVQPYPVVRAVEQPQHADEPIKDYLSPVSYSLDRGAQIAPSAMPFNQHDWPLPPQRRPNVPMMSFTNATLLLGSVA